MLNEQAKTFKFTTPRKNVKAFVGIFKYILKSFKVVGLPPPEYRICSLNNGVRVLISLIWIASLIFMICLTTYRFCTGPYTRDDAISYARTYFCVVLYVLLTRKIKCIEKVFLELCGMASPPTSVNVKCMCFIGCNMAWFIAIEYFVYPYITFFTVGKFTFDGKNILFPHKNALGYKIVHEVIRASMYSLRYYVPNLTMVLVCYIYYCLDNVLSRYVSKISALSLQPVTSARCKNIASDLLRISKLISSVDEQLSTLVFLLLSQYLMDFLILTLYATSTFKLITTMVMICVVYFLISVTVTIIFASRIPQKFRYIKKLISSDFAKQNYPLDIHDKLDYISLCELTRTLSKESHMTALGMFKLEKNLIGAAVGLFVTYGTLFYSVTGGLK